MGLQARTSKRIDQCIHKISSAFTNAFVLDDLSRIRNALADHVAGFDTVTAFDLQRSMLADVVLVGVDVDEVTAGRSFFDSADDAVVLRVSRTAAEHLGNVHQLVNVLKACDGTAGTSDAARVLR